MSGGEWTTRIAPQLHPMTLGDILDGAFKLFKANARVLVTVTAAIIVPVQVVGALLTVSAYTVEDLGSGSNDTFNVGAIVLGLASLLVTPFVTGAISRIVAASFLGQSLPARPALRATWRKLPALMGAWFLVHLVEGSMILVGGLVAAVSFVAGSQVLGVIALIISVLVGFTAALAAMALLQATVPAIVVEEIGPVRGMKRSWRLMRPRFWPVLGVAVLSGIMSSVIGNILSAVPTGMSIILPRAIAWIPLAAAGTVAALITTPFIAIVATLVYFDGRIRFEGFDLEVMAADLGRPVDG